MNKTKKLVLTGLFAALCCVATFIHIPIPTPTGGYTNLGDCFVLTAGFFMGPLYGAAAAGIGSMLCDILLNYMAFAPATLVIKGLMAFVAALIYSKLKKMFKNEYPALVISSIIGELVMVFGYFAYEATVLGFGLAAAGGIYANLLQGVCGIVFAPIVFKFLQKRK